MTNVNKPYSVKLMALVIVFVIIATIVGKLTYNHFRNRYYYERDAVLISGGEVIQFSRLNIKSLKAEKTAHAALMLHHYYRIVKEDIEVSNEWLAEYEARKSREDNNK